MWLRLALVVFIGLFASLPAPAEAKERVQSIHADIHIARTGKVLVTETIRIVSEGKAFKHGIYRDFPLGVMTADGMEPVAFEVLEVDRDGAPENHIRGFMAGGTRVYLGKSDALLPPGEHTYRWTYRIDNQIRDAGADDMFAWNVTGRWEFPIESASASVKLPNGTKLLGTEQDAGMPEMSQDTVQLTVDAGTLLFKTTMGIAPGGQMHIKIRIPRNAIDRPPQ